MINNNIGNNPTAITQYGLIKTANNTPVATINQLKVNNQPPADGAYFLSNVAITEKGVTTNHVENK